VRRKIPQRDSGGKIVLHLATEHGRNEILVNLLEYVHDPTIIDTQDNSGKTALHLAS
jgi:ankyrin repeat protein